MSNTNEHLNKRFMERYARVKTAEPLIEDCIKMLKAINSESDCTKVVEDFLSNISQYGFNVENLNEVKQILHEFVSNEMTQNEALAYLNYLYDVTIFKAEQLWFMKDIFKCYF